ncbi:hypothetical protein FI667_g7801, partial [Globisporangium splendens]
MAATTPAATFDWERALQQDRRLPRMQQLVESILHANFPAVADKLRKEDPPARQYATTPMAPAPVPTAPVSAVKQEMAAAMSSKMDRLMPEKARQSIPIVEQQSDYLSASESSEMDTREVDPMDELSDFETQSNESQREQQSTSQQQQQMQAPRNYTSSVPLAPQTDEGDFNNDDGNDVEMDEVDDDGDEELLICVWSVGRRRHGVCGLQQQRERKADPVVRQMQWRIPSLLSIAAVDARSGRRMVLSNLCANSNPSAISTTASQYYDEQVAANYQQLYAFSRGNGAPTTNATAECQRASASVRASFHDPTFKLHTRERTANQTGARTTATAIWLGSEPRIVAHAFESDAEKSNQLLIHACQCDDAKCVDPVHREFCPHMKRFLRSACWASHSEKWRSFRVARVTAELFAYHALQCHEPRCNVPMCDQLRAEEFV